MIPLTITRELFHACRELFGPEVELSADFLDYLQPEGVKSAFRQRAKITHPDLAPHNSPDVGTSSESFLRLHNAYTLVNSYLVRSRPPERPRHSEKSPAAAPRHDPKRSDELLYSGLLPQRHLTFGRYLYYLGIISYETLINALTWQRHVSRRMGVLARECGWLTINDVSRILSSPGPGTFGERAVRIGLLTDRQCRHLLLQQRINHRRIGEYFVSQGILTAQDLDVLVRGQHLHNARIRAVSKQ